MFVCTSSCTSINALMWSQVLVERQSQVETKLETVKEKQVCSFIAVGTDEWSLSPLAIGGVYTTKGGAASCNRVGESANFPGDVCKKEGEGKKE